MAEERRDRRQTDRIEKKLDTILEVMNGVDGKIGLSGKVDIMWSYRYLFICLITANAITIVMFVSKMLGSIL